MGEDSRRIVAPGRKAGPNSRTVRVHDTAGESDKRMDKNIAERGSCVRQTYTTEHNFVYSRLMATQALTVVQCLPLWCCVLPVTDVVGHGLLVTHDNYIPSHHPRPPPALPGCSPLFSPLVSLYD